MNKFSIKFLPAILALVLIMLSGVASAAAPITKWTYDGKTFSSAESDCVSKTETGWVYSFGGYNANKTVAYCNVVRSSDGAKSQFAYNARLVCADNSVPNFSKPLNEQCPDPPDPDKDKCKDPKGKEVTWTTYEGSGKAGSDVPDGGSSDKVPESTPTCGLDSVPSVSNCYSVKNGGGGRDFFCEWKGTSNGANSPSPGNGDPANPGTPAPPSPPSPDTPRDPANSPPKPSPDPSRGCPGGTVQVGVNSSGVPMCSGEGTDPPPKDTKPSSSETTKGVDADGNPTVIETVTKGNSDGSTTKTTTTTTTKPDGTKNTTTTVKTGTTPDGGNGKPDKPESDLCKQNPGLNICKNSEVSGQCEAIACAGDAIQCATLRAAAALECRTKRNQEEIEKSSVMSLGQGILSGIDPMSASLPTKENATSVNVPTTLDSGGWLGGGACFSDQTFSLQGRAFTIPFSKACEPLIALRYAIMIIASLVSFRMLSGAILRA